jgi:transposase
MVLIRKVYPSDVSGEEWALVVPYLTLMTEAAPQRRHALRELFNGLRYVIRYGIAWRAMPNDRKRRSNHAYKQFAKAASLIS